MLLTQLFVPDSLTLSHKGLEWQLGSDGETRFFELRPSQIPRGTMTS